METAAETHLIAVGVDIQNDFCPDGSLAVPQGSEVVQPFNTLAARVRDIGGDVVLTRDWHPAQTTHFDTWPVHCVAGTPGADFHPDLFIAKNDIVMSKGMGASEDAYSGFQARAENGATLQALIESQLARQRDVELLIGGLATDYCVRATVLDALKLQKRFGAERLGVTVLRRCIRAVNVQPTDGEIAIAEMQAAGARLVA